MDIANLQVLTWPDRRLTESADPVTFPISVEDRSLVDHMIDMVRTSGAIGLAATQLGINRCVFVMDPGELNMPWDHWNPQIVTAGAHTMDQEGCLSFPGVSWVLKASSYVLLRSFDRQGSVQENHLHGLQARCAEHEVDHLLGRTMLDRMGQLDRKLFLRKYTKLNRK